MNEGPEDAARDERTGRKIFLLEDIAQKTIILTVPAMILSEDTPAAFITGSIMVLVAKCVQKALISKSTK